ncbi:MAG: SpoIID/LytB domain protein [Gemmatimonadetes bacterium]|nr:SpoIID/LytB domain protein [Gemmatimonadota bacterium]
MATPVAAPPRSSAPRAADPSAPPNTRRAALPGASVRNVGDTTIRVLLSSTSQAARVASPNGVTLTNRDGSLIARAARDEVWHFEREGRRVRAVRPDGVPTVWTDAPIVARAVGAALLNIGGKPYRGDAAFYAGDTSVLVVNVVKIDDYLRGVVPLEIGTKSMSDSAAVQAQAVTARSYAYIHLGGDARRVYDVTGGVLDQVYGGVAAETPVSSEAVESTRTLVLKYDGRVVNAPYSSTCGGATAAASEIWRSNDEPYLQSVSDRIPGTERFYCDGAPRFRWTRTMDGATVNAALAQYLAAYTAVPGRKPGVARAIAVASHTESGRVGTLAISTDRGNFTLRGNDIRYVLRPPGGEILNSTYFSVEAVPAADGSIGRLTIHGNGYGHGVGMCQSGAIGRARAGQDFRTILHTYYPGTTVGPAE